MSYDVHVEKLRSDFAPHDLAEWLACACERKRKLFALRSCKTQLRLVDGGCVCYLKNWRCAKKNTKGDTMLRTGIEFLDSNGFVGRITDIHNGKVDVKFSVNTRVVTFTKEEAKALLESARIL